MPTLKKGIEEELKVAIRAGETLKISVLRMILSAITNREIEVLKKESGLTDEEILEVLSRELKKRKDAAREFKKGGRDEMAEKEEKEAEMIAVYLPQEISDEDLRQVVSDSVREADAKGMEDFGHVMKLTMSVLKGQASGERVSEAVKKILNV